MEKENTAKSGTGGTQAEQDKNLFFEKFMSCCAAMSGPGGMDGKMKDFFGGKGFTPEMMEKMKDCCGGKGFTPEMMEKMKDCCGGKGFIPEMMEKWKNCCGTGDK